LRHPLALLLKADLVIKQKENVLSRLKPMKLILILFNIHQILFHISIIKNHNINSFNTISRFFKFIFLLTLYFKSGLSNFSSSGRKPNRPSNQHSYNAQAPPQSLQNANKPPNLFSQQQQQQLYFAQQSAPRMNVHINHFFILLFFSESG